jgi:hypothetical protein
MSFVNPETEVTALSATGAAEWVPTVASREVELTSKRLRNYEYNPVGGFLADQAWVR